MQPRLHPDSPPRPHLRTRRACAPLPGPSGLRPEGPTPEPACPPRPRLTPRATPCVGALEGAFDLAKGRERRAEGRSGDGVARAGWESAQVPVGKPRGFVGATFRATPVPGAPTPTGCPTLTTFFFQALLGVFSCVVSLSSLLRSQGAAGVPLKMAGTIKGILLASWPQSGSQRFEGESAL